MSKPVNVEIEYGGIGYASRVEELRWTLEKAVPEATVKGHEGQSGAFEIKINDKLIFSKLKHGFFPFEEHVIEQVRRASLDQPTEVIEDCVTHVTFCSIM